MPLHTPEPLLEDGQLLSEIQLLTDLIITATASPASLPQCAIDRALGVTSAETARA